MKQTLKKSMRILLLLALTLLLCACGSKQTDTAETQMEEAWKAQCETFLQQFTSMADKDLEGLAGNGKFYADAVEAWQDAKETVGDLKEITSSEYTENGGVISIVIHGQFEKKKADVTMTLMEETGAPTSMTIEPEQTMAEKMKQAGINTVVGIGTVFLVLIFLSFIISLFRFIRKSDTKKEPAEAKQNVAVPAPVEEIVDDGELIAVIAAAVAAAERTSTDDFVVRSVKKVRKNNWKRA